MPELLEHLSFHAMRNNPACNFEETVARRRNVHKLGESEEGQEPFTFMRKGKVGSWKEELSSEMIRKFDAWVKANKVEGLEY